MSDLHHQITLALRTAAGHARAANDVQAQADKTYDMKMKSAGAAVYEAWGLAVRSQPEYAGRKIDDKALVRIYESTKARPWWDKLLAAVKVEGKPADREWAKRTLQWHLDPDAARARRTHAVARSAAHHRKVKEAAEARPYARPGRPGDPYATFAGSGGSNAPSQPTTGEMRKVGKAAELGAGYGTQSGTTAAPASDAQAAMDEIDRLLARVRRAAAKHAINDRSALAETTAQLRDLAENVEGL